MNDGAHITLAELRAASTRVAREVLQISENRLELLKIEAQEARERLLRSFLLALGVAVLSLLAGIAFTIGIILLFWDRSPLAAVAVLTTVYAGAAIYLGTRLMQLQRDWQDFPTVFEQLHKDCECLTNTLH